jgi:anthranilate synthase component 1
VERFASEDPLGELERRVGALRAATLPSLPPFAGGAIGYAGYDVVRYTEHLPDAPPDDRGLPDLSFAFFDRMVIFDNVTKTITVVAMARVGEGNHEAARNDACRRVDELVARLETPDPDLHISDIDTGGGVTLECASNFRQEDFEAAVRKCVEYIRAGDIFQVVISQPQPVHVLPAHAVGHSRGQLARSDGARGGWARHGPAAGRHAPPRSHRRGRPAAGRGTAG